jgi:tRNA-splicing ligase RtcB
LSITFSTVSWRSGCSIRLPPEVVSVRVRADAPYRVWGSDLEAEALTQMRNACKLPVAVTGALMPDAHVGYGLPIGGVLATRNAVIPYAVGVDIACRMKMSVLDLPPTALADDKERLTRALERETRFGVGAMFSRTRDHDVMDADWNVTAVTARMKDRAWSQLGTSGSGNHFVEFGELIVTDAGVGLRPGRYVALLSHSGSRGTGAQVADHYSRLARDSIRSCRRSCRTWRGSIWKASPATPIGRRWS